MATTPQTPAETDNVTVQVAVEVVTDPVGFRVEASVADRLPQPAAMDLIGDIKQRMAGGRGNLLFQAVRVGHGTLRSYGSRNDYAVDPITETVEVVDASVQGRSFEARVAWTHEAAKYFQFGVSPHTIDGNPILSFIWEDAPREIREMFSHTERVDGDPRVFFQSVDHPGIPESRYVNAAMNWLRQELA
jgi:hypothetical protein